MSLNIEKEYNLSFNFPMEEIAKQVMDEVVESENCPYECSVNLLLVNDKVIHEINKEYRQIDRPTDVLSFPMLEEEDFTDYDRLEGCVEDYFDPETGELLLGDIIVSLDKVVSQAEAYGHSVKREYAFLIAHSMLHLFGYDHMTPQEAEIMEEKQRAILEGLGITR